MNKSELAYEWIAAYAAQHGGMSPTYREIMRGLGYKSPRSVGQIVAALERAGRVRREPGQRGLRLLWAPRALDTRRRMSLMDVARSLRRLADVLDSEARAGKANA